MRNLSIGVLLMLFIYACTSKPKKQNRENPTTTQNNELSNHESKSSNYGDNENSTEIDEYSIECKFEDGTYSATVDYYNPETGYSATYTLDVEVQDCQVIQINFPNDGYLDEDHISYADIDEDGYAMVDGEDGKTYEVQIDN